MARISGVNIPTNKKLRFSLAYIYGIGRQNARDICKMAGVDEEARVQSLTEEQVARIRAVIDEHYKVEGDLRREIGMNIKRLVDLNCYRGIRHRKKLPVRGQRTHSNARTRKGRGVAIAGKKIVAK